MSDCIRCACTINDGEQAFFLIPRQEMPSEASGVICSDCIKKILDHRKTIKPVGCPSKFHLCASHRRVLNYVSAHPGCCKYMAVKAVTYNPLRDPSKQYYLVNTLIRNGWITATFVKGKYNLHIRSGVEW